MMRKGLLITTLGVLFIVPDSLFVRLIDADAMSIAFWRLFLSGGMLAIGLFVMKGTTPFRAVFATGRYGAIYMVGVGASGLLFTLAVSLTSIANVVFIIASLPVFAALFSRIFLGEPVSKRMQLTMLAVIIGLFVIAYGSGDNENASLKGDALSLAVSALFAAALTAARKVKDVSMVPAAAMGYVGAALLALPFALPFSIPSDQIWLVLMHGTFVLAGSAFLAIGPRYISSAEIGLLVLLESALAPVLAWAVIGEHPGQFALLGGTLVVGALFVSNLVALKQGVRNPQ